MYLIKFFVIHFDWVLFYFLFLSRESVPVKLQNVIRFGYKGHSIRVLYRYFFLANRLDPVR